MCSSPPSLMEIPTVVITPSTPNFGGMPFERDDKHSQHPGAAEKLYGLGFSMGSAASPVQSLLPGQTIRSRRQSSRYQGLALSLSVITLFILVLVLPTVSLRNIVSDSVSRDVDALKTFAGFGGASLADMYVPEEGENAVVDDTEPALSKRDETSQPYRPAFGPGQGRRSVATAIEQAKRQDALQRRSAAAWRASALDDAIAAKLADLHGPGGVGAAAVYISQDHYDEDSQLYKRSSPSVGESVEGDAEVVAQAQTEAKELLAESEEGAEEVLGAPNSYNLPAAPKAPWSLENEINAKQKEAGRLASS